MKIAATVLLSLSVLLTNCMGVMMNQALKLPEDKLEIKNDSFEGTKVATLEMQFNSEETEEGMNMKLPLFRIIGKLHREVSKDTITTSINLTVFADQTKDSLKSKAYIKVDKNNTKVQLKNLSVKDHTSLDYTTDGFGNEQKVTDISTQQYKIMKGKIIFDDNTLKQIHQTSNIQFRLYAGDQPITFSIAPKRMNKVMQFMSVK